MFLTQFFSGLPWQPSEFPGFYTAGVGNSAEYICAYNQRNNGSKELICSYMNQDSGIFDCHHIIEKQHLADISGDGRLEKMSELEMPTVLLHNRRHQLAYNAILHVKQTRYIYIGNEINATRGEEARQEEAVKLFKTAEGRKQLKERTLEMKDIYFAVYQYDFTLKQIAMNLLDYYLKMF